MSRPLGIRPTSALPHVLALTAALALVLPASALAYEGKWTPEQVLELGDKRLRDFGLRLPAKRLWDPKKGTGLLAGAVWISGCSAGFVSDTGLLVTNHHCLFSILQEHATPERDVMTHGHLARKPEEELRGKTTRVRVPRRFTDVTKTLLAAVPQGADDKARMEAIDRKGKELVAACEAAAKDARCSVHAYDGGLWYTLVETHELSDVRLVYAPPRAVGEYGGEVDNWSWPRHSGDFAVARAYGPDGKPYKPAFYFPISPDGVKPDDFVMLMGYPGRTYRALIAAEVAERVEQFFPAINTGYAQWIRLMEGAAGQDATAKIAIAADAKSLSNRRKNAEGQLAGFARGKLFEKKKAHEAEVMAFAKARKAHGDALAARSELESLVNEARRTFERDFLVDHLASQSVLVTKALGLPTLLARVAQERVKPDLERELPYMERNLPRLRDVLEREQKRLHLASDRAVTVDFIRRALALPGDARIGALDKAFGNVAEAELPKVVERLYAGSKVFDLGERLKMFEESEAQLRARKDPLLELGFALAAEVVARQERKDRLDGAITRLRPPWRRAVIAQAGRPVDPDANGTLRVSFARVKGYAPKDGIFYTPQSTLLGMAAKHTGEEPFDVPSSILTPATEGRHGRWKDARLGDVTVNFLADADTTGGNSGSPVVDARGRLVGVNFDRVWENVANDFGYNPDIARNISADLRYMLWHLDVVADAGELLKELGIPRSKPAK